MRGLAIALLMSLGACGQPPEQEAASLVSPVEQPATPRPSPARSVDAWQTDITAYPLNGATLPAFTAKQDNGVELTQDNLRNRWTILGFQQATDDTREAVYITALNTAVDQDPDLDFLSVVGGPAAASGHSPAPWPHIDDPGGLTAALQIAKTPAYLLVGPDLTIEGYREALAETPDDGIKSTIRGVAQIRKQVAAPE